MTTRISQGKRAGINACANARGIIAALAVDHRDNLLQAIAAARGAGGQATSEDMIAFKTSVTRVLAPYASALLLDVEYGLTAVKHCASNTGILLAYEKSGYDFQIKGRLPDLLPAWSVRRLVEAGARAIKILLYYNPFDDPAINRIKQAYIERIGAECQALDVPFFLEPLVYDEAIGPEQSLAFARKKPLYVAMASAEFSRDRYGVDVLKVELPINPAFVAGTRAGRGGEIAYSRQDALGHLSTAAQAAEKPLIYLSAGVSDEVFCEMLELAAEANVPFAGVLCGRATWSGGIAAYAQGGTGALEHWLGEQGVQHIQTINALLARCAVPWWQIYGEQANLEVTGS
ncbi:MAG TPA: tagatose 1,6-diphosphate aldolase [Ktedonobacteraceae bacterium]|nr:tagatose 1,6-diphosphate aldolase [Ktedonobacteraceae bacterium]